MARAYRPQPMTEWLVLLSHSIDGTLAVSTWFISGQGSEYPNSAMPGQPTGRKAAPELLHGGTDNVSQTPQMCKSSGKKEKQAGRRATPGKGPKGRRGEGRGRQRQE